MNQVSTKKPGLAIEAFFRYFIFTFLLISVASCSDNFRQKSPNQADEIKELSIAGLRSFMWLPVEENKVPLVIFSHGFHGCGDQSRFLMERLSSEGYFVVAPNHSDASCDGFFRALFGGSFRSEPSFLSDSEWSDSSYINRAQEVH